MKYHNMTPLHYYQEQLDNGLIIKDLNQSAVMEQLDVIYQHLLKEREERARFFAFLRKPKAVQGLYVWGGVGIGKTFMMDCFYQCLPFPEKMRMHFHQFMKFIHAELKVHEGERDPLTHIAEQLAKKTLVLCFDEFFVTDITDAMILGRLLRELSARGVCLIATSNAMPDDLYKNGLQRQQFIPAINMIKTVTTVIHLPTSVDYRLRHLKDAGVFHAPNNEETHATMEKTFAILGQGKIYTNQPIEVLGRLIPVRKQADNIIWFDFNVICGVPRSQLDYLVIAEKFKTVFISGIPVIPPNARDTISLFIRLVDVFYDMRVRLVCSAATSADEIYSEGYMLSDYIRTRSRLSEMQSEDYFINGLE